MNRPATLPITPSTVTINGSVHSGRSMIWAGLRMLAGAGWAHPDGQTLSVPWCHWDDDPADLDKRIYRLRPRDERYRFEKARNGMWILTLEPKP